jgi:hypothetical protein
MTWFATWATEWRTTPGRAVLDGVRGLVVIASLTLLWLLVRAVFLARTGAQKALLAAFGIYVSIDLGYQVPEFGEPWHWRILVQIAGLAMAIAGAIRWIYWVPPAPLPPPRRRP